MPAWYLYSVLFYLILGNKLYRYLQASLWDTKEYICQLTVFVDGFMMSIFFFFFLDSLDFCGLLSIMSLWLSYLRYQVSHGDKHKDNSINGHHSVHLLSQEVQKEGKKCHGGWVDKLNKGWELSEVHPV